MVLRVVLGMAVGLAVMANDCDGESRSEEPESDATPPGGADEAEDTVTRCIDSLGDDVYDVCPPGEPSCDTTGYWYSDLEGYAAWTDEQGNRWDWVNTQGGVALCPQTGPSTSSTSTERPLRQCMCSRAAPTSPNDVPLDASAEEGEDDGPVVADRRATYGCKVKAFGVSFTSAATLYETVRHAASRTIACNRGCTFTRIEHARAGRTQVWCSVVADWQER